MNKNQDILITGIPRSGTSLLTKLISEQPNTLCLSEPTWMKSIRFGGQTKNEFCLALKNKINNIRKEIKQGNPVEITVKKGTNLLPDNYFIIKDNKQQNMKETLSVNIEFNENLRIIIKTNTLFTVCLPELLKLKKWKVVSMVRKPKFVLMSWRNLNIPISYGKIRIGELYSEELRKIVKIKNLLIRQVKIIDWFYKQYLYNESYILKYEKLVEKPNEIISGILDIGINNQYNLESKNLLSRYNSKEIYKIESTIDTHCKSHKAFYE